MTDCTITESTPAAQSANLNDLERLWGDPGQNILTNQTLREHYIENGCPLPPPPPPPVHHAIWHQPLCA